MLLEYKVMFPLHWNSIFFSIKLKLIETLKMQNLTKVKSSFVLSEAIIHLKFLTCWVNVCFFFTKKVNLISSKRLHLQSSKSDSQWYLLNVVFTIVAHFPSLPIQQESLGHFLEKIKNALISALEKSSLNFIFLFIVLKV